MAKASKTEKKLELVKPGEIRGKSEKAQKGDKTGKTSKSAKASKPDKTSSAANTTCIDSALKAVKVDSAKIGSSRGIESMFRNSYRAQLDMIALAATKANIMISLNGVLVSMLLISGAYFLASDPLLLIPLALFLLTCTIAITFAVLAARPDIIRSKKTLEQFRTDEADLLIFDQFASLSSEEFNLAMQEMMQSNERVYANMISHIYNLGCMANKKFTRLHISYSAFIFGLIASVVSLIGVVAYHALISIQY
jgi:hypothetical protein